MRENLSAGKQVKQSKQSELPKNMKIFKISKRKIRHIRVKKKLESKNPRLVVTRSNKFVYAQIVNDTKGVTLASASDLAMRSEKKSKLERAKEIGENLAKLAAKKNIKKVVFDRAGYKYHGRVKAVAEGARIGGLEF